MLLEQNDLPDKLCLSLERFRYNKKCLFRAKGVSLPVQSDLDPSRETGRRSRPTGGGTRTVISLCEAASKPERKIII